MEGHKKGVYIHLIGFREHSQSQKFKAMVLTSQREGGGGRGVLPYINKNGRHFTRFKSKNYAKK